MPRTTVGLIGFGDFGKFLADELVQHANVLVADRNPIQLSPNSKLKEVSFAEALAQDTIILAIPSQALEDFLTKHKNQINPKAIVVDVCSVKVRPVEIMQKILSPSNQILATHPLFGPNTAKDGFKGQKIMLYPVRVPKPIYLLSKQFLIRRLGLKVIECSPEEHDQMMAYAQGLSHYIGRVMQILDVPDSELATKAYRDLLDMKNIQANDSWDLFESIMSDNQFSPIVHKRFKEAMAELDDKLGWS